MPTPKPVTLRTPFKPEEVGKLPRSTCRACSDSPRKRCDQHQWVTRCQVCGNSHTSATMHIDFVGHADVTSRLLDVDPEWTWAPFTAEEMAALPPNLRDAGLWINLTVNGVTRPGFGDCNGPQRGGDAVKIMIGDALRNAAMRFGVALDLWAKGDREWAHAEKETDPNPPMDDPGPRQDRPGTIEEAAADMRRVKSLLIRLDNLAESQGISREAITAKWRADHGDIPVEALDGLAAQTLQPLVDRIEAYVAKQAEKADPDPQADPLTGDQDK